MAIVKDPLVNKVMREFHCNHKTAELIICSARLNGEECELRRSISSTDLDDYDADYDLDERDG